LIGTAQIIKSQVYIGIVNCSLKNPAIHLEKCGPGGLSFLNNPPYRPFQRTPLNYTLNTDKKAQLPLDRRQTCLLGKPNI
ncbi:hypothetical protein MNAB215_5281, partial [Mycobacterium numidiamassiliense]